MSKGGSGLSLREHFCTDQSGYLQSMGWPLPRLREMQGLFWSTLGSSRHPHNQAGLVGA